MSWGKILGRLSGAEARCLRAPEARVHWPGQMIMQQIRIFKGLENDAAALEKEVNSWLAESGVRVLQITGNIAPQGHSTNPKVGSIAATPYTPSDILIVVLYEKP